jgi:hypothetical protein
MNVGIEVAAIEEPRTKPESSAHDEKNVLRRHFSPRLG